jgi:hypothetical protein
VLDAPAKPSERKSYDLGKNVCGEQYNKRDHQDLNCRYDQRVLIHGTPLKTFVLGALGSEREFLSFIQYGGAAKSRRCAQCSYRYYSAQKVKKFRQRELLITPVWSTPPESAAGYIWRKNPRTLEELLADPIYRDSRVCQENHDPERPQIFNISRKKTF